MSSEWYAKTWSANYGEGWKLHSINWDRGGETVEEVWVKDRTNAMSSTSYTTIVDKKDKKDKKNPKDDKYDFPNKKAKLSKSSDTRKTLQTS